MRYQHVALDDLDDDVNDSDQGYFCQIARHRRHQQRGNSAKCRADQRNDLGKGGQHAEQQRVF